MHYATKLLECITDYHLGNTNTTEWLQNMAQFAQCEAVHVVNWTAGRPETAITYSSAEPIKFDAAWLTWVDRLIETMNPKEPDLLENIAQSAEANDGPADNPLTNPELMISYLDSYPAISLLIFQSNNKSEGWSDNERKYLRRLLPGLLKAHLVHKKLTNAEDRLQMANSAMNGSPRAMIGMSPTGEIFQANDAALDLQDGTTFATQNGRLTINEPRVMQQLNDKLGEMRILQADSVNQFIWNRSFRSTSDGENYQLMLRGFILDPWHLETSAYDRFAVLTIGRPDSAQSPTVEQLRDFYDLSNAQARVVLALLEGNDVMTSAAKLHISINTMRSHMRSIYAKLGASNQSDLLRLLTRTLVDYTRK
jgi:DNA-binding CsgD family transcriptional regulator